MSPHHHCFNRLQSLLAQETCVLVTLIRIMGSAPRESGCRMVVTAGSMAGSIGGGNLEYTAIAQARQMLVDAKGANQEVQSFGLGPALNQCCGGAVNLHFERIPAGRVGWLDELIQAQTDSSAAVLATAVDTPVPLHHLITSSSARPADMPDSVWQAAVQLLQGADPLGCAKDPGPGLEIEAGDSHWWLERIEDNRAELWLFGAGHVGQEVAQRVRGLPFRLHWVDQRPDIFPPDAAAFAELVCSDPVAAVNNARTGSIFVVMTHSHELDEDICHAILERQGVGWDFRWLGLIGSDTKRKRFVQRLRRRGSSVQQLRRLVCPIGLSGIRGKQPATIALSLAAQLMMESTWTDAEN